MPLNRIGGVLCPYVNMLSDFWTPLPLIIYGGLATAGGLLALLLPETLGIREGAVLIVLRTCLGEFFSEIHFCKVKFFFVAFARAKGKVA